jgi:hypothetical protein
MEEKKMSHMKSVLFLSVLAAVPLVSANAATTYAVGWCEPGLPSFETITEALGATPAPTVVEVCPGTYNEQVVITNAVALEGISVGDSAQAIIAVPSGGLAANATTDSGQSVAAQVWVDSASGEVKLTNVTVDATGNNVPSGTDIVGVFFQNSPGTVSHFTIQNQNGNGSGVGIWLEGGSANPSVNVEDTNLQAFDDEGMVAETNSSTSELTATITGNQLTALPNSISTGIDLVGGLTATVSGNLITVGSGTGVAIDGGHGSVSKNTVLNTPAGIDLETDGVSVTSNTVYNTLGGYGIGIIANSAVAPVTGNTVAQSPFGILFECNAGGNVHSNTILDAVIGLYQVPIGAVGANTYYNVGTVNGGGC